MAKFSFIRTEERPHVVCNCKLSLDSFKMFDNYSNMWGTEGPYTRA
jgi:hypothetical protein